ncbi:microphthalmia-associated transcription factor-like isoform X2 [Saccostrea echinata]|uniref:microphthalmia-associated transcription factor-like isoform X2 n=1 Tax=Saccostrea echinata TaxID=191078 RepID=UPI002A816E28|nr:microphthalmia-associated transcription factor-like isoform X2 [Saccostrea echinata]
MGTMGDYDDIGLDLRVPKMSPESDDLEQCDSRTESDAEQVGRFLVDGSPIKLERSESDTESDNPGMYDNQHIDEVSDADIDIKVCYPNTELYRLDAHNNESDDVSEESEKYDDFATTNNDKSVVVISGRRQSGEGGKRIQLRSLLDTRVSRGGKIEKVRVIKSPNMTKLDVPRGNLRANLRLQLMKMQAAQEDQKKEQMTYSQSYKPVTQSQPQTIQIPAATAHADTQVPSSILTVKTPLQNPTQFHVSENQKRQIHLFLHNTGKVSTAQSMPALTTQMPAANMPTTVSGSAPTVDPDSPLSMGFSSATNSVSDFNEVDNLLNDLISLESVDPNVDQDLNLLDMSSLNQMSSTLPHSNNILGLYNESSNDPESSNTASSCPAKFTNIPMPEFLSEEEQRMWAKDRQKKDNHNMIERRRRFNINDRIKELGTLLPKSTDPDMRQNKGTILKASVDYIRRLKRDQDKMKTLEARQRQLEMNNRKMLLRMQQMELLMKAQGMQTGLDTEIEQLTLSQQPVTFQTTKFQPDLAGLTNNMDVFMDDGSPVNADPMLSSEPVSPSNLDDSSDML